MQTFMFKVFLSGASEEDVVRQTLAGIGDPDDLDVEEGVARFDYTDPETAGKVCQALCEKGLEFHLRQVV